MATYIIGDVAEEILRDFNEKKKRGDDDELMADLLAYAEIVKEYWQSISPVGGEHGHSPDPHIGLYRDSIEVQQKNNRVYVVATDPKSNLIEYGSVHNPPFACRIRTAQYFGGVQGKGIEVQVVTPRRMSVAYRRSIKAHPGVAVTRQPRKRTPKKK